MADMLVDSTKLDACLNAEADAIRAKTGDANDIPFDFANNKGFADAIAAIPSGGGVNIVTGTFTPASTSNARVMTHGLGTYDVFCLIWVDSDNYAAIKAISNANHKLVKCVAVAGTLNASAVVKTFLYDSWRGSSASTSYAQISTGYTTINKLAISGNTGAFLSGVTYNWAIVKYGENTTNMGNA